MCAKEHNSLHLEWSEMAFRCSAQARKFCVLSQWCQESSKNLPCGKPLPHLQESNQSRHPCGRHNYRDWWKHRILLFSFSTLLTFTLFEKQKQSNMNSREKLITLV